MQVTKTELLESLRHNDLLRSSLLVGKVKDNDFLLDPYIDRILLVSRRIWQRCEKLKHDPIYKVQIINEALFKELKIEGKCENTKQIIDDPDRYYVHVVLDRKMSSSLTLAILYSVLAEQVGLPFECIAFPSYYLLKIHDVTGDFYVDPFDSGRVLSQDEFHRKFRATFQRNRVLSTNIFERVSCFQLVTRLMQQIKHAYILKGKALEALRAVEMLTAIFPQSPEVTRDRGILYCEMEYFSKAMEDLKYYIYHRPHAEDIAEIKKLANMLKSYREVVN